jgi:hypothetical protein
MTHRYLSKRLRRVPVLFVLLSLLAQNSRAAEFFAIVDSFDKKPLSAYVDISVDSVIGPVDIVFDVFGSTGGTLASFTVTTNRNGFASSASIGNLFALTGGQPMLVHATTLANATPSAGMLHSESRGLPLTMALWPTNRRLDGTGFAMGKEFNVALGKFRSAWLLVANVGGSEQVVDVHVGTRSADGSGVHSNPRLPYFGIWRVQLSQAEAQSNLVVSSTGAVVVQMMIDDGTKAQSFVVLPSN